MDTASAPTYRQRPAIIFMRDHLFTRPKVHLPNLTEKEIECFRKSADDFSPNNSISYARASIRWWQGNIFLCSIIMAKIPRFAVILENSSISGKTCSLIHKIPYGKINACHKSHYNKEEYLWWEETDKYTVICKYFTTPLSIMCRANRQKINKGMQVLNSTIAQPNTIDIYTLNSTAEDWIFLLSSQGTFTKIGYILYHETQLDKIKRLKITPSIFSD